VFRTQDEQEDRLIAVKAFTLDITPERTQELADALQQLVAYDFNHPNIVRPVAAGIEEGIAYLAQQYVGGESLDAAVRQYGPAPVADAARLIGHVAEALEFAARSGILHGSLHPRDVLVTPGDTFVTGLGVAQALQRVGQHGPIRRPYAAPEREAELNWGGSADVFALAVISYEVLTGRRALPGTEQPLPGLASLKVYDADALRALLESAIDIAPSKRPAGPREFAAAFGGALLGASGASAERGSARRRHAPRGAPLLPGLDEEQAKPELPGIEPMPEPEIAAAAEAEAPARRHEAIAMPAPVEPPPPAVAPPVPPPPAAVVPSPVSPAAVAPPPVIVETPSEPPARPRPITGVEIRRAAERIPVSKVVVETAVTPPAPPPMREPAPPVRELAPPPPAREPASPPMRESAPVEREAVAEELPDLGDADRDVVALPGGFTASAPSAGFAGLADEMPDLRLRPTPQPSELVMPPAFAASPEPPSRSEGSSAFDGLDSLDLPPRRRVTREQAAEARWTDERTGEPLSVPRALDPTGAPHYGRDAHPHAPSGGGAGFAWGAIAAGVVVGLVIGLAGGYELGVRWGTDNATAVGVTMSSGVVKEAPPAPVPPPAAETKAPAAESKPQGADAKAADAADKPAAGETKPAAGETKAAGAEAAAKPAAPAETPGTAGKPAAAADATAAAADTAPATAGRIGVRSTPTGSDVWVNGTRSGITPRTLRNLEFGEYVIKVSRPGYVTQERTVRVSAAKPVLRLDITLKKGGARDGGEPAAAAASMSLTTRPPGARVLIDGKDVGVTPIVVGALAPGSHRIEFRLAAYRPWSTSVVLEAGTQKRLTASLDRDISR